jgi:hypothetical protein
LVAVAASGIFTAAAVAASPHIGAATATMNNPTIVAPGNITWDASLVVPFQATGLGKNGTATATLEASTDVNVNQAGSGATNTASIDGTQVPVGSLAINVNQVTPPAGGHNNSIINLSHLTITTTIPQSGTYTVNQDTLTAPGTNTSTINLQGATETLTVNGTGQATGTLTIPLEVDASTTGNECVQVSWTNITLTVGGTTFNVAPVSNQYDSTGSFC